MASMEQISYLWQNSNSVSFQNFGKSLQDTAFGMKFDVDWLNESYAVSPYEPNEENACQYGDLLQRNTSWQVLWGWTPVSIKK